MSHIKRTKLVKLYEEIWQWGQTQDESLARREIKAVDTNSCLVVIGEAHAATQVRLTGVNWFDENGNMGSAGKNLEAILNCVGYSVRPPTSIPVAYGQVARCKPEFRTVYTTEIYPCYPVGRKHPDTGMLKDALRQGFLVRELEILRPKVIVLLGRISYKSFYRGLLRKPPLRSITGSFELLSPITPLDTYKDARIIPFLHPSSENGHFMKWYASARSTLCEQPQIQALKNALESFPS